MLLTSFLLQKKKKKLQNLAMSQKKNWIDELITSPEAKAHEKEQIAYDRFVYVRTTIHAEFEEELPTFDEWKERKRKRKEAARQKRQQLSLFP